jgi:hypothetical protein
MDYLDHVPPEVEARLRELCLALPESFEESAWKGVRWMVRRKTFAHVLSIDDAGSVDVVLTFRASPDELEVLRRSGPPFRFLGWGRDAMGLTIDAGTDWEEVRELVTESYCVLAPKRLVAQVDRPSP